MPRHVPIALLLLALGLHPGSPLLAQDDPKEALKKKLDAALEEFYEAEAAYDEILREMKHDFDLVRGEHWQKIAPKFEAAILAEAELLRKDPKHALGEGLRERFRVEAFVCSVTVQRMVKAMEPPIRGAAKDEGAVDAAAVLAAGLEAVFPEETFEDCWDNHFMDLPQIARYDEAEAAVDKLEAELAAPLRPPLPDSGGPKGTVHVPKGSFEYGPWTGWVYDLEKNTAVKVRAEPFYIDAFEVTNDEFRTFLSGLKTSDRVKTYLPEDFRLGPDGTITIPKGSESHPVTGVTFAAASAYAQSLGKRLPTEEEWEYAARGVDGRLYPWGAEFEKDFANSEERGLGAKEAVGSHPKDRSPFGAYDMAGNVSELTSTLAGRKPATGKLGPTDAIIWRGGNFQEDRDSLKTTYRWTIAAIKGKHAAVGFRCVVSAKDWKAKNKK